MEIFSPVLSSFHGSRLMFQNPNPLPLRNEQDYRAAMASLEQIFTTARPGTPEGDEFECLSALIGDYEARNGLRREDS
jgi:antitoxin component HigA of HigAB toxin-antitoxin module